MQRIYNNDETKDREKQIRLANISVATNSAGFAGAASMGLSYAGLFANHFHSPVGTALTGLGSFILYPIIAFASAVETVLSWMRTDIDRRKKDNKLKNRNIANSIISTLSSVGFTAAIIGSLIAATTFALAAPIMFMSVIGGRALYNAGAALYYNHKSATVESNTKYDTAAKKIQVKAKYTSRANEHAKSAALGAISLIATTTVFLLGYLVFAPIGMVVNAVFMAMTIAGISLGIKSILNMRKSAVVAVQNENLNEEQKPLISAMHHDVTIDEDKQVSPGLNDTNESIDKMPALKTSDRIANDRDWSVNTGIFVRHRTQPENEDNASFLNDKLKEVHHGFK